MTKETTPARSQEQRMSDLAPEMHNDEQDDHRNQAQEVAQEAQQLGSRTAGGTESLKVAAPGVDGVAGSETDMIDQLRSMEETGIINNGAFAGEPNHDDNTSKYGDKDR